MRAIKQGYELTVTDGEGYILGIVNLEGYNLEKSVARSDVMNQIEASLPAEAYEESI